MPARGHCGLAGLATRAVTTSRSWSHKLNRRISTASVSYACRWRFVEYGAILGVEEKPRTNTTDGALFACASSTSDSRRSLYPSYQRNLFVQWACRLRCKFVWQLSQKSRFRIRNTDNCTSTSTPSRSPGSSKHFSFYNSFDLPELDHTRYGSLGTLQTRDKSARINA